MAELLFLESSNKTTTFWTCVGSCFFDADIGRDPILEFALATDFLFGFNKNNRLQLSDNFALLFGLWPILENYFDMGVFFEIFN